MKPLLDAWANSLGCSRRYESRAGSAYENNHNTYYEFGVQTDLTETPHALLVPGRTQDVSDGADTSPSGTIASARRAVSVTESGGDAGSSHTG